MRRRRNRWLHGGGWMLLALALACGCQGAGTGADAGTVAGRGVRAQAGSVPAAATAGAPFDYYLLSLSWAPEYCHGHPNSPECDGSHRGFVVHGLWPQNRNGGWPEQCSPAPGLRDPAAMLDIMPDRRLIAHEWAKHGTCTGLTAETYFRLVREAYGRVKIPEELRAPSRAGRRSADEIKAMFTAANPGMKADGIALSCHNRYLAGVSFCMSKDLKPMACEGVRDCDQPSIRIPVE